MPLIFSRWSLILLQWENIGHLAGNPSTSSSITCRLTIPTSASVLISLPFIVVVTVPFKVNLILSLRLNSIAVLNSSGAPPLHKGSHFPMSLISSSLLALSLQLINIFKCPNQRSLKAFHNGCIYSPIAPLGLEILRLLPLLPLFPCTPQATNLVSVSTESALVKITKDFHTL